MLQYIPTVAVAVHAAILVFRMLLHQNGWCAIIVLILQQFLSTNEQHN